MVDTAIGLEHEVRPPVPFRELVLDASFQKGRQIPQDVESIDLGIFAEETRELVERTVSDPRNREHGKIMYATRDRKLLLQSEAVKGETDHVVHNMVIHGFDHDILKPWYLRQDRMMAADFHSHPRDVGPSSQDLMPILVGDFNRFAATAIVVGTPKRIYAIFRGPKAPQMTDEEVRVRNKMWEGQMEARIRKFWRPGISTEEEIELNHRARETLLRQISGKYDLPIFVGDISATTLKCNR